MSVVMHFDGYVSEDISNYTTEQLVSLQDEIDVIECQIEKLLLERGA